MIRHFLAGPLRCHMNRVPVYTQTPENKYWLNLADHWWALFLSSSMVELNPCMRIVPNSPNFPHFWAIFGPLDIISKMDFFVLGWGLGVGFWWIFFHIFFLVSLLFRNFIQHSQCNALSVSIFVTFFLADRQGSSISYSGFSLSLSIYRQCLRFSIDNLFISWPILMKLGMEVDIRMGYVAPKPCSAWVITLHAWVILVEKMAFSDDNLVIFRPISMKLEI